MKIQIALSTLLLSFATMLPPCALAQSAEEAQPMAIARNNACSNDSQTKSGLQLSDEQKETLYNLKNKFKDQLGPKKAELQSHQRKMKDLLTQATIDKTQIKEEQNKILALQSEITNNVTDFKIASAEILTPEQRKLVRQRSMRSGKRGHHKHSRQGFRPQRSEATVTGSSLSS